MANSSKDGAVGCLGSLVFIAVIGLGIKLCSDNKKDTMETKEEPVGYAFGRDPYAYDNMEDLYKAGGELRPSSPSDRERLEAPLPETCYGKDMVPKAECTTRLDALGPVRHLEVVQNIVTTWAKKAANAIRSERATLKPALLREAETEYKNGAFSRAAQKYEVLLAEAPAHLDVRNNYALAQMHLGHDVAAQMQLEALHELDPRYVPAMVNLTVLYERAWPGDGKRIASMAEDALMLAPKTGPVVFNAAWCRQRACQMSSASELLKPLVSDNYGKAAVLERATWADCN